KLEHATDDEIIALLSSVDLAAEPVPADTGDRARELAFLSHALSEVQRRGDTGLAVQLWARMRALELHPGTPAARRPSVATRVETFLRQESEQRGTSWMVLVTLLVLLFAALVIYGPALR